LLTQEASFPLCGASCASSCAATLCPVSAPGNASFLCSLMHCTARAASSVDKKKTRSSMPFQWLAGILIEVSSISRRRTLPYTRTQTHASAHTDFYFHNHVPSSEEDSRFVDSFSWVFSVSPAQRNKEESISPHFLSRSQIHRGKAPYHFLRGTGQRNRQEMSPFRASSSTARARARQLLRCTSAAQLVAQLAPVTWGLTPDTDDRVRSTVQIFFYFHALTPEWRRV
jgi:hypothetical protein